MKELEKTEADFSNVQPPNLSEEKLKEICTMAKFVIVGAYDGEGYIFWEKTSAP